MRIVDWSLAGVVACFLLAVVVGSMDWRVELDAPIMLYQAFLMDRYGFVPYRDFFDMNMPGSYLAYFMIGKVFGYGDLGVRLADLLPLLTMSGATTAMWWRVGRAPAVLAGSLVALRYLGFGQLMTLQREFLLLVAVSLGTAVAVSAWPLGRRALLAGLAFGLAITVKPHAGIGLLPIVVYLAAEAQQEPAPRRALLSGLGLGILGTALPLVVALAWMVVNGVLDNFVHALGYLPYYGALDRTHTALSAESRPTYLLRSLLRLGSFQGLWLLAIGALAWGVLAADLDRARRRILGLFGGMLLVYTVYPAASGQFWNYHWLPMNFWIAASIPALFLVQPSGAPWPLRVAPRFAGLVVVAFLLKLHHGSANPFFHMARVPTGGRPDAIARFLRDHLEPGDTVQSIAWAGDGITHGMLLAEAELATPYVYAFHFYHHVSTPYIRGLKRHFIHHFDRAEPDYVVRAKPTRPWVRGRDTSRRFPRLERR
ncbi:MAG: hypothetical protein AAF602_27625, partial [Myxococcota bacterium]